MEGWRLGAGIRGAGEPMSVGGLVAIDGFSVLRVWAVVSASDARSCRLLLLERVTSLRSMSSRALFWLFSMLKSSDMSIELLMIFNYKCWMIETNSMLERLSSNWRGKIMPSLGGAVADQFVGPSRSCAISA